MSRYCPPVEVSQRWRGKLFARLRTAVKGVEVALMP